MRDKYDDTSLRVILENFSSQLKENLTEEIFFSIFIQCCQNWGISTESELIILLTSDQPFVERSILLELTSKKGYQVGKNYSPNYSSNEIHTFIEKILLLLSAQHILDKYASVSVGKHLAIASISNSVSDLLQPNYNNNNNDHNTGVEKSILDNSNNNNYYYNYYNNSPNTPLFFSTGCSLLDQLISGCNSSKNNISQGGFRAGFLTEIYGEAGSGKTQLVLQTLLQCIAQYQCEIIIQDVHNNNNNSIITENHSRNNNFRNGMAALYIVSEDFAVSRLSSLAAGALKREKQKVLTKISHFPSSIVEQVKNYLDKNITIKSIIAGMHIRRIHNIKDLLKILNDGTLLNAFHTLGGQGIIVIDSIAGAVVASNAEGAFNNNNNNNNNNSDDDIKHYNLNDNNKSIDVISDIIKVGSYLKSFAIQERAAILVTNQVRTSLQPTGNQKNNFSSFSSGIIIPALGIHWGVAPHIRINLRRLQSIQGIIRRQLILITGPSHAPICVNYIIGNDGIEGEKDEGL